MLRMEVLIDGQEVPMRLEMKRMAPGETNTWFIEVLGTDGGVRYSTKEPKTLWMFERGKEQVWQRIDLGYQMAFPTITGGIFEAGFPDCFLQMWAAYAAERSGALGSRFGCARVEEAVWSHELFRGGLKSHQTRQGGFSGVRALLFNGGVLLQPDDVRIGGGRLAVVVKKLILPGL